MIDYWAFSTSALERMLCDVASGSHTEREIKEELNRRKRESRHRDTGTMALFTGSELASKEQRAKSKGQ
jgi:hypothetical protein